LGEEGSYILGHIKSVSGEKFINNGIVFWQKEKDQTLKIDQVLYTCIYS
jgi:membrane-bound inhibitor of C-type lysozyme